MQNIVYYIVNYILVINSLELCFSYISISCDNK